MEGYESEVEICPSDGEKISAPVVPISARQSERCKSGSEDHGD